MNKIYALYKCEECLGTGTLKELADMFHIKYRTMYFYTTPTYKKRCKKGKKRKELVYLGKEEK